VKSPNAKVGSVVAYVLIGVGALLMIAPFYFMFVFATHPRDDIFKMPPPMWFGWAAYPMNYGLLLRRLPTFWWNFAHSVKVAVITTALQLFFCSLAGYAFSMYDFKFKKQLFATVLATMLIPPFLGMVPTFIIMKWLGLLDTHVALWLPAAVGALGIFMMRQYISSAVPKELIEAARCDGCSEFRIYWNVVLPLLGPAMGTLGLITFIGSWNNFMSPLIVLHNMEDYTIPLALRSMQDPQNTPWGAVMLGASLAVLPLLILFIFSSRRLIAGLTAGALKG
jgi:multiple sugar transport system permease protein